jgi:uncharacterized protein (DUF736 family)
VTKALTYDPFGWRHTELGDPTINSHRRDELVADLVASEAEELASGRRHVTVVHGTPTDLDASARLDRFHDTIRTLIATAAWSRMSGGADYITLTIADPDRDRILANVVEAATCADAGGWVIVESPHPLGV